MERMPLHPDNERGDSPTRQILHGVAIRNGLLSHEHNGVGGYKKNFQFSPKTKKVLFCIYKKFSYLWGGKGGAIIKTLLYMIYFRLNTLTDFGLGVSFRVKEIRWYNMYTIELSLIIFSLSFVFTKYNS